MMDEDEVFFNILKENLLFMRHQETQRMWIANVFVAIVAGSLAYIGKEGLVSLPWYVYCALTIISLLCLLITLKLNHVFTKTKDATEEILKAGKIPHLRQDWKKYMAILHSKGKWNKPFLSVRWLYFALYALAT
ncbi:unnamed protein product, partial [marine sediment metagenome]